MGASSALIAELARIRARLEKLAGQVHDELARIKALEQEVIQLHLRD